MALALQTVTAMKLTAMFLLALVTTACAGDDDAGNPADAAVTADADPNAPDADPNAPDADPNAPDATPRAFANHVLHNDCAPNDGPALRLLLTDDSINDQCRAAGGTAPSVEIVVYTRSITAPQTITFTPTNFAGNGTHCLGGAAPCRVTQQGELHFETYTEGVGATGTWTLDFNGTLETGRFEADYCELVTICG